MPLPRRSRRLAAASGVLALALVGCGSGDEPGDAASGGTGTGTSGTSTTSSASSSPTTTTKGGTSPSSSAGSTTSPSPDPKVTVTTAADTPQSAADRAAGTQAADASAPATSLSIPAVGLSKQIGPQGLRGGKVNPAPGEVIWFTGYDRVRPGAAGTTVIAGHVVSGGKADSFAALEQLTKGDGVVLTYPGGAKLRFEVTSTDIVDKDELTTNEDVWGANSDTRRIVLVTCDDQLGFRDDGHRKANFVAVAELPS